MDANQEAISDNIDPEDSEPWSHEYPGLDPDDPYGTPYCDGCGMCTCYGCILKCGCRFNCMGDIVHKLPPAELRIKADELNHDRVRGFAYFMPSKAPE